VDSSPLRLGAVDYLNVRPLVEGLDRQPGISLRFDVPSVCAALLEAGEIDLGMVPSITYADRPGDRIVPGLCIGSDGPVASVALFHARPLSEVRSIALDTSSRTSAALTRILCARHFGISPAFAPHDPDLQRMLEVADAALLIGDPALFARAPAGVAKTDLGAAWTELTGLPFVWAFWAGRPGAASPADVRVLQQAARAGMARTDQVADRYLEATPERQAAGRQYLRDHLMFELTARAIAGLERYLSEAAALGLIAAAPRLQFFDDEGSAPHGHVSAPGEGE
jgi:chorismate dehydratase